MDNAKPETLEEALQVIKKQEEHIKALQAQIDVLLARKSELDYLDRLVSPR